MATLISTSVEQTIALGEQWAGEATRGWVIGLCGDLGVGKTQLVKGLARGLGLTARVHSPTFTLINEYLGGRLPLFHLDLYRLDTREQVIGAGLEEFLYEPEGVSVIEWADRWFASPPENETGRAAPLPRRYRHVVFEWIDETTRRIRYEDSSA